MGSHGHEKCTQELLELQAMLEVYRASAFDLQSKVRTRDLELVAMVEENEKMLLARNGFAEKADAAERLSGQLKDLILQALSFMKARHEWKPTAPHADMIRALEMAVAFKEPPPSQNCGAQAHPSCGKLAEDKRCDLAKGHSGGHRHSWGDGCESVWA